MKPWKQCNSLLFGLSHCISSLWVHQYPFWHSLVPRMSSNKRRGIWIEFVWFFFILLFHTIILSSECMYLLMLFSYKVVLAPIHGSPSYWLDKNVLYLLHILQPIAMFIEIWNSLTAFGFKCISSQSTWFEAIAVLRWEDRAWSSSHLIMGFAILNICSQDFSWSKNNEVVSLMVRVSISTLKPKLLPTVPLTLSEYICDCCSRVLSEPLNTIKETCTLNVPQFCRQFWPVIISWKQRHHRLRLRP